MKMKQRMSVTNQHKQKSFKGGRDIRWWHLLTFVELTHESLRDLKGKWEMRKSHKKRETKDKIPNECFGGWRGCHQVRWGRLWMLLLAKGLLFGSSNLESEEIYQSQKKLKESKMDKLERFWWEVTRRHSPISSTAQRKDRRFGWQIEKRGSRKMRNISHIWSGEKGSSAHFGMRKEKGCAKKMTFSLCHRKWWH